MYSNYGSSFTNNKKVDPKPSRSSGFGGMGSDPAERFGGSPTRGIGSKPTFNFSRDDDSSGADNNPNRDAMETKSTVEKLYDKAVTLLRNFGASEPEDVIVDGKAVYKGPAFRGYDPTTRIGDFGGEYGKKQYLFGMPSLGEVTPRSPTPPTLPPAVDNPSLNMFGVQRGFTRNPAPFIQPPLPEAPANMDPMTRVLSQAMIPPSDFLTTAEYTVSEGESLLTVLDTLNAGKPNSQKVTLEELGELNNIPDAVADPFGKIEKGQVIKVPVKKQTAVGDLRDKIEAERSIEKARIEFERLPEAEKEKIRDRYRLLEQAQPASFVYDNREKLTLRDFYDLMTGKTTEEKIAEKYGIKIETDKSKVQEVVDSTVGLASKQYTIKKGDTLSKIARAKGTTLTEIKKANPNIDADNLRIGQRIKLPQAGAAIDTLSEIKTIQVPDGNLKISTGTRSDHPTGLRISLDYNSAANPNAKGTLVVIPDNASQAVRDAAEKFNDLVVQFAASKGYEDYENRGVRTRSENKRGVSNTIHVEPFFQQDSKMEQIVNENFAEFAKLYTEAFGGIDANMIAPHGNINSKGIQDKGATSKVFGTELDFGNRLIKELMDN